MVIDGDGYYRAMLLSYCRLCFGIVYYLAAYGAPKTEYILHYILLFTPILSQDQTIHWSQAGMPISSLARKTGGPWGPKRRFLFAWFKLVDGATTCVWRWWFYEAYVAMQRCALQICDCFQCSAVCRSSIIGFQPWDIFRVSEFVSDIMCCKGLNQQILNNSTLTNIMLKLLHYLPVRSLWEHPLPLHIFMEGDGMHCNYSMLYTDGNTQSKVAPLWKFWADNDI